MNTPVVNRTLTRALNRNRYRSRKVVFLLSVSPAPVRHSPDGGGYDTHPSLRDATKQSPSHLFKIAALQRAGQYFYVQFSPQPKGLGREGNVRLCGHLPLHQGVGQ